MTRPVKFENVLLTREAVDSWRRTCFKYVKDHPEERIELLEFREELSLTNKGELAVSAGPVRLVFRSEDWCWVQ